MNSPIRVVFDCNVFLQALARPAGPAGSCVTLAFDGKIALFISEEVLDEIKDVTSRPELVSKFQLRRDRVEALIDNLPNAAVLIRDVPVIWTYDRDPDDAHYVNLALAAGAHLIVSRDRDLLDLADQGRPEGRNFHSRFPLLRILDPVGLLEELRK